MSELKRCPFCGGENIKYTYIDWADVIRCYGCGAAMTTPMDFDGNRKEKLKNKWNTRKPMERILERLEIKAEKAMDNSEKAAELGQAYEKHMIFNGAKGNAFEEAIEIVKEEGGIE